ncbi:hypothetical protein [Streptomyces sp. NPDC007083]|uniref:hypothetical protein n=1 Tax=Streptomyces sp. NPDC007083 TaxID=3156913 RepID=UPI0033DDA86D
MSKSMLVASIAVPADRSESPDFDTGRQAIEEITDVELFEFDDPNTQIFEMAPGLDPAAEIFHDDGRLRLDIAKHAGSKAIDVLEEALGSEETTFIVVAGYQIYLSAGISSGDMPTEAAEAIWNAHYLPGSVLLAMGFVPDCSKPLARKNGSLDRVSDTDVVDAIALGMGTKAEWSGDELEWIADTIGKVRPHPGGREPGEYHKEFTERHCFDPTDDNFLNDYVGQCDDEAPG